MAGPGPRYDDLAALYVNCTLKPSPELSHTQGLIDLSAGIMRKQGVDVETIRAMDHDIATGVWPDMTELLSPSQIGPATTRMSAASTLRYSCGQASDAAPCSVMSGHTPVAMS